jgi:hypothetical protein
MNINEYNTKLSEILNRIKNYAPEPEDKFLIVNTGETVVIPEVSNMATSAQIANPKQVYS